MDWTPKQKLAKRLIDKFGTSMDVVTTIPTGYAASTDTLTATIATYDVNGVIINPTMVSQAGVYGKSDQKRVIIQGVDLPDLESIDFKIIYGALTLVPERTISVKPGGTAIIYLVDVK